MDRDGAAATCNGKLFHRRADAIGNAVLPTVDSRVRRAARHIDEAERNRCLTSVTKSDVITHAQEDHFILYINLLKVTRRLELMHLV